MWFSLGIDFIINVVVTSWILISRSKHDGKEVVFNLSGGSHTGTTVLMIVFWIIFAIHLIFCIARESSHHKEEREQAEMHEKSKIVGEIFEKAIAKRRITEATEKKDSIKEMISKSDYPINKIELKFLDGGLSDSRRVRLLTAKATDSDIEYVTKHRLTDSEFTKLLNGSVTINNGFSKKSRMKNAEFLNTINNFSSPENKRKFNEDIISEAVIRNTLLETIKGYEPTEPVTLEMIGNIPNQDDARKDMEKRGIDQNTIKRVLEGYAAAERMLKKEYKRQEYRKKIK